MSSTPDKPRQALNIKRPGVASSFALPSETSVVEADPTLAIPRGRAVDSWPDRQIQGAMAPVAGAPEKVEHALPPREATSVAVLPVEAGVGAPAQLQGAENAALPPTVRPLESIFNQPVPEPPTTTSAGSELNLPPHPALAAGEIAHVPEGINPTVVEHAAAEPLTLNPDPASADKEIGTKPLDQAEAESPAVEEETEESAGISAPAVSSKPTPLNTLKNLFPFGKGKHDDATQWNKKHSGRQQEQDNLEQAA